jgi:hypothetical protein
MATEVKHRRGTTAEHQNFTGAEGEVTIDTDRWIPVVHDGVTQGGHPVDGGSGVPDGGITGQVLKKLSDDDGDADWQDEDNNIDGGIF